jgi:hypothetical protein
MHQKNPLDERVFLRHAKVAGRAPVKHTQQSCR